MTDLFTASPIAAIPAQHTPDEVRLANPRRTTLSHDGRPRRGLQMVGAAADSCVDGVCAVPEQV
jgi:hypothetical protein